MEEEADLAEHGQQWVMAGPSALAWVVPFEGALLFPVTLKDGGIQVQGVAFAALRQTLQLPLGQRFEQAPHLAHAELSEQVANRVIGRKPLQAQQRMQGAVPAQQAGVGEAPGARQHRH